MKNIFKIRKRFILFSIILTTLISFSIQDLISSVTGGVKSTLDSAVGAATGAFTGAVTGAVTGLLNNVTLPTSITGALNNVTGTVTGAITGSIPGALTGNVTGALNNITGAVTDAFNNATGILENLIDLNSYYRDIINAIPIVPVPSSVLNFTSSSILLKSLEVALARMDGESVLYYLNNCTDDRVETIFEYEPTSEEGKSYCQELVFDWGQTYAPYKCNDWFCNSKGKCNFKIDEFETVVPNCICSSGYSGQNCMFNNTIYENAKEWIDISHKWLINYLTNDTTNKTIIKESVVNDLLDITTHIIMLSSNANEADLEKFSKIVGDFANAIMNANVTMNSLLEGKIYDFMDFIFNNVDSSLQGVDPTELAGLAEEPYKITDKYETQKTQITDNDLNLSPKDAANIPKLRFLLDSNLNFLQINNIKRILQNISTSIPTKPVSKKVLNPDSAKAFIPKKVTSSILNNTITFVIMKDPSSMTQLNSVSISSQIVSLRVTQNGNNNPVPYPTGSGSYQIYLPWEQVPFRIPDNKYGDKCKVYSFDKNTWTQTQSCSILAANTTSSAAYLDCSTWGTLGVSCTGASVTAKKTTGSIFLSSLSYMVYGLIGVLLF